MNTTTSLRAQNQKTLDTVIIKSLEGCIVICSFIFSWVDSWIETYTGIVPYSYLSTLSKANRQEIWRCQRY